MIIFTCILLFLAITYSFATLPILNKWVEVKFEPRDLWIGIFWNYFNNLCANEDGKLFYKKGGNLEIYVCLIPTLPIIIKIRK